MYQEDFKDNDKNSLIEIVWKTKIKPIVNGFIEKKKITEKKIIIEIKNEWIQNVVYF